MGGELFDARVGNLQGEAAAYEIFSWEQVSLSIQNDCSVHENRIEKDLHPLILEAARRKDEKKSQPAAAPDGLAASQGGDVSGYLQGIRLRIEQSLGTRCGVESVFQDSVWKQRAKRLSRHGERLKLGNLVMGYIDRGEARDYIVLAGEVPAVIAVSPKCPRDKLMQLLAS